MRTADRTPVAAFGIAVGTPVGLEVRSPACHQSGDDVIATGTVVADGAVQSNVIRILLTALRPDGSFGERMATYPFPKETAGLGVDYVLTATTGRASAQTCDVAILWGPAP